MVAGLEPQRKTDEGRGFFTLLGSPRKLLALNRCSAAASWVPNFMVGTCNLDGNSYVILERILSYIKRSFACFAIASAHSTLAAPFKGGALSISSSGEGGQVERGELGAFGGLRSLLVDGRGHVSARRQGST